MLFVAKMKKKLVRVSATEKNTGKLTIINRLPSAVRSLGI